MNTKVSHSLNSMASGLSKSDLNNLGKVVDNAMQSEQQNLQTQLESLKIDPKEILNPPQIAWQLLNTKTNDYDILGTLGNFSVVTGKAKAKKTFFISIAVAAATSTDLILSRFKSELPREQNEVLYFDTEQSKFHVQKALKRICKLVDINEPTNLHTYHLRSKTPAQRLGLIEHAIYNNKKIGFVVIDGIKDLVTSINDEAEATMIASKLLKWTEEQNIHIVTVLHQNKGDNNARGHIGTELINKAETVLSITKSETDSNISIVEPQQCRNMEPETIAFEIIDDMPEIAVNFELRTESKKNKFGINDLDDIKKFKLLTEVFSKGESFKYGVLIIQLKIAYENQFKNTLGDNKAKVLKTFCENRGWLIQDGKNNPYTLGIFNKEESH